MRFSSDNIAPVHPRVLEAMAKANVVDTPYDGDALNQALNGRFSALFEHEVTVIWMSTGTAANALALSLLCPPYGGILTHESAHVVGDECGAIELQTGGARLLTRGSADGKLAAPDLRDWIGSIDMSIHKTRPYAVSLTNVTETGRVYTPGEMAALGDVCRERGLAFHIDGARFANAIAHLDCSPADLSWRAGIDALSFGFTKNGAMNAEALILFDKSRLDEAQRRRKRGGHLLSKGRYVAAQLHALLDDDLWLVNARASNLAAQPLAKAAPDRLMHPVEANMVFIDLNSEEIAQLNAQGFGFYAGDKGGARMVTSWHHQPSDAAPLAAAIAALRGAGQ